MYKLKTLLTLLTFAELFRRTNSNVVIEMPQAVVLRHVDKVKTPFIVQTERQHEGERRV